MQSKRERRQLEGMVAHDLVNKLAAIIGHCDLLIEMPSLGTEYVRRLTLIRDTAESAAKELKEHQRDLDEPGRKSGPAA